MGFKTPDAGAGADHDLLSITHLDTTPASPVVGDLIAGTAGPVWSRLPIGNAGDFLKVVGGLPSWQPVSGIDHGGLGGLADDDHSQYALLAGRVGNVQVYPEAMGNDAGLKFIQFPTSDSNNDFSLGWFRATNPNGARFDDVLRLGYNVAAFGLTQQDATDGAAAWSIESHYQPNAGQQNIEMYGEIYKPNQAGVFMRPWGAYYNKVSDSLSVIFGADTYNFLNALGTDTALPRLSFSASAASFRFSSGVTFAPGVDIATALVMSGTAKGIRFGTSAARGIIEGVDSTGTGSFQPLAIGGSTLSFEIAQVPKLSIDATGKVTITGTITADGIISTSGVGIGTINPQANLHILDTTSDASIIVETTVNGGAAYLDLLRQGDPRIAAIRYGTTGTGAIWYAGLLYNGGNDTFDYNLASGYQESDSALRLSLAGVLSLPKIGITFSSTEKIAIRSLTGQTEQLFRCTHDDVAHNMLSYGPTTQYFLAGAVAPTVGGLLMITATESVNSFVLYALAASESTTKGAGSVGAVTWYSAVANGAGGEIPNNADANIFTIRSWGSQTLFNLDAEGDLELKGALNVYGDHAGLANSLTFVNSQNTGTGRSTGVGTVKFADATARDNVGFMKVMVGTTAYYVPLFAAN